MSSKHKITKRKDGLYQADYYVNTIEFGKKRQFVYGKTEEIVREKLRLAIINSSSGCPVLTTNLTVEKYMLDWVKHAKRLSDTTRCNYTSAIKTHILPYIGTKRLSSLNVQTIQQLINCLMKNGKSVRTTQIVRNILSRALREAEPSHLVTPNIVKYVQLEKCRPKKREIWSLENCILFLNSIQGHKYELFFTLYITYGLRRGEVIPLTWEDIDFELGIIHINKQYTIAGKDFILTTPKTDSSIRDLPLLPHIKSLLDRLVTDSKRGPIIEENGKLINPRSINYEFNKLIKENSLPKVTLHSLRHFAATGLKDAGLPVKEVQEVLGHSNPKTTLQFYQHGSEHIKQNGLENYSKILNFA